jgi:hypothetical protein
MVGGFSYTAVVELKVRERGKFCHLKKLCSIGGEREETKRGDDEKKKKRMVDDASGSDVV